MTSPRDKRIDEDIRRLRALRDNHPNLVQKVSVAGTPVSVVRLSLGVPTAANGDYPRAVQDSSEVQIELSRGYPHSDPPKVSILSPVWNPNVYPSGLVCPGEWIATQGLDLLALRVMRILAFDPLIINTASSANAHASTWYVQAKKLHPTAFPTIPLDRLLTTQPPPKMSWKNLV